MKTMKHILIFIFFSLSFALFGQNDTHPNFTQSQLDSALNGTKQVEIPSHFNSNGDKNTWDLDLKDLGDVIKAGISPTVDTDIKLLFSIVNDSIRIDSFDNKLGTIVGSPQFIDDAINKPQNIYKKCDGTDLLNGDKVYEVKDLSRQSGMGATKQNGTDCLGNNDEYYDDSKPSLTAFKTFSGNNAATGAYSRVAAGYLMNIQGARSVGSGYGNTESGGDNLIFGQVNTYDGVSILGGGLSNTISASYPGGAYVNGISNTGIGGYGSILSGDECVGSVRSWVGGYHNKDLNSLTDNYIHGEQSTFTSTMNSFSHAQSSTFINDKLVSSLSSFLAEIKNSTQSGVFGGQLAKMDYAQNSFILGGEQGNEIKGTSSNMSQSSIIIGGQYNQINNGSYIAAIGSFNTSMSSDVNYLMMIGTNNKGVYGNSGNLTGNYLKATNYQITGSGNHGLQWTNGSKLTYSPNDVNWHIGCGFNETSTFNAITMLKNGWINFNPTAPSTSGIVQLQSAATPEAPFHVNVVNQSGNVDGGVLLAPINNAQLTGIPSGNLKDGMELYCTDCIANDSSVGVKMVYQASTSTWKKLW